MCRSALWRCAGDEIGELTVQKKHCIFSRRFAAELRFSICLNHKRCGDEKYSCFFFTVKPNSRGGGRDSSPGVPPPQQIKRLDITDVPHSVVPKYFPRFDFLIFSLLTSLSAPVCINSKCQRASSDADSARVATRGPRSCVAPRLRPGQLLG